MKNNLKLFFKNNSLWIQVSATIVATIILSIIPFLIGLLRGLDFISSIQWAWDILNAKVNLLIISILIIIFMVIYRWSIERLKSELRKEFTTKDEFKNKNDELLKKISGKLDNSSFESFTDVYDYRRLKNHPWHDQYTDRYSDINSFKGLIWYGKYKNDEYKIENGIRGLIAELNEHKSLYGATKTEIMNELKDCFPNTYNSYKEELINILNSIQTY